MNHMWKTVFCVLLFLAPIAFCSAQQKARQPALKVAVMADGRIIVNGTPATMESFRASLKKLSQEKGIVWYFREDAKTEAPKIAKQVIQAVIDARLPIRLSSRPDYSDAIGMNGKPVKQQ